MKESLLTDVFWHAGFFLALSALVIPVLRYFKIPVALGYLLAGIVLGPYALGALSESLPVLEPFTLKETEHVKILAELGVVLLLFVIGLEVTPSRLWQMRSLVFGLGGVQVLLSAVVIGTIAYFWGNNVQVSVLLGLSLALSSTAIVIQWIHEQKLFVTPVGRSSFGILLFQDLAVIPILLLLTIMSAETDGSVLSFVSFSLLKMVGTVLLIYFIGKIILKPVFLFANRHGGAEVFVALSLLVIVVSASVAAVAGLSMALGAFIAGLLLADTEYRHEIASLIVPFKSMLLGIFFLSFGMTIDLHFIAQKPFWLFASVIGLISIKASIIFALCKLWKQTTAVSIESAILLSQAGEFGLLVVGGAIAVGLMDQDVGQFMLIVVGLTMLLAPVTATFARRLGKLVEDKSHDNKPYHSNQVEVSGPHIVILGYGRVGEEIGNMLCQEGFEILGFEKNMDKVNKSRAKMAPVYLGDASRKATLTAANLENALCVVVTIDDANVTKNIIKSIRNVHSSVPVVIRAHNLEDQDAYNDFENVDAIAENILISQKLSEKVFVQCGVYEAGKANSQA
jgi:CPA2 family monovalent cation:H+ antiporter-2